MSSFVRDPKDFWSGWIFVVTGLAVVLIAQDYPMGSAGRMGPAYFPTVLGGLLAVLGAIAVARSMYHRGAGIEPFAFKPLLLIIASVLAFGFLVHGLGLALSIVLLVMISGLGSRKFRPAPFLVLAVAMAAFASLVFIKGLGLPMPLIGSWFGI
ncbi:MAG TPA: tripartite tricarboxylate transporter TctB family protein [Noviherbaspirillum sp.]|nr:tripartite tricarboxylate transporter TctB family protein [Noviherbaspirillum sp.]